MQALPETLYTVSAEFNVGIIGQENKRKHPTHRMWPWGLSVSVIRGGHHYRMWFCDNIACLQSGHFIIHGWQSPDKPDT